MGTKTFLDNKPDKVLNRNGITEHFAKCPAFTHAVAETLEAYEQLDEAAAFLLKMLAEKRDLGNVMIAAMGVTAARARLSKLRSGE